MKIQIIGVGVVGGAQAHLASKLGHEVIGVDRHKPSFEYARIVRNFEKDVDVTFVCTPEAVAGEMVGALVQNQVKGLYVIKSTVPPGTTRNLREKYKIHLCHNPEFLVENKAFESVSHPNVVIIGQCCTEHADILRNFYLPMGCPIVVTQPTASETVKLTLNSYLATLISFWNAIDKLARALGVKTDEVAGIARFDPRVSSYGTAFFGAPFGGKCLPKDLDQIIKSFQEAGVDSQFLEAVRDFNRTIAVDAV